MFVYCFLSSFPFRSAFYCLFTTLCRPFLFVPLFTVCLLLSVVLSFSSHCLLFVYYFLSSFSFRLLFTVCLLLSVGLFFSFCPLLFVHGSRPEGMPGMSVGTPCLESQGCHLIPLSYLLSCFSLTLSVLSFSANGPFSWLFSRKFSNLFH